MNAMAGIEKDAGVGVASDTGAFKAAAPRHWDREAKVRALA